VLVLPLLCGASYKETSNPGKWLMAPLSSLSTNNTRCWYFPGGGDWTEMLPSGLACRLVE